MTRAPTIGLPPFETWAKMDKGRKSPTSDPDVDVALASSLLLSIAVTDADVHVATVMRLDSIWLLGFEVTVTMFFLVTASRLEASASLVASRGWCHSMVYCHVMPIWCGCNRIKDKGFQKMPTHLLKRSATTQKMPHKKWLEINRRSDNWPNNNFSLDNLPKDNLSNIYLLLNTFHIINVSINVFLLGV